MFDSENTIPSNNNPELSFRAYHPSHGQSAKSASSVSSSIFFFKFPRSSGAKNSPEGVKEGKIFLVIKE